MFKSDGFGPGYTPAGVERVYGQNEGGSARRFWDVKEVGKFPVQFPTVVSEQGQCLADLFSELREMGLVLLDGVSEYLGQPPQYLSRRAEAGNHMLRVAFYPAETTVTTERFPAHRDFGLLTLSLGGIAPGLEFEIEGEWTQPETELGDVVLFGGNIMRLESSGRIGATRHRVVSGTDERLALMMFLEPGPEVLLANGELAGDYLKRLVRAVRA